MEESIKKFSLAPELETRTVISKEKFKQLLDEGKLSIKGDVAITQWWVDSTPKYRIRVRQEEEKLGVITYTHTIKYVINDCMCWEVTTPLNKMEFSILYDAINLSEKKKEVKQRLFLNDKINTDFIVSADIKEGKPDTVFVEWEDKDGMEHVFVKPDWWE